MSALVASGLGRRYGKRWGIRDCWFDVPDGHIVALVGPNGAGKTTLLLMAAGLLAPTAGSISVLGRDPSSDPKLVRSVGFLSQEIPLFPSFTVAETLELGAHMNPAWDADFAIKRMQSLGLPADQKAGDLSGGERAQLALILALGKRPRLLLLDEPLAHLDPLARRQFLQVLMECTADSGMTVILSSHLITDLERVCDYLILLSRSRLQVTGRVEEILETHRFLNGRRTQVGHIAGVTSIIRESHTDRQTTLFARTNGPIHDPDWEIDEVSLEELVIAYLENPDAVVVPAPQLASPRGGLE
jgi:ABC-2 type transport system ATP-binding protein